jgi:hypothetical protein
LDAPVVSDADGRSSAKPRADAQAGAVKQGVAYPPPIASPARTLRDVAELVSTRELERALE